MSKRLSKSVTWAVQYTYNKDLTCNEIRRARAYEVLASSLIRVHRTLPAVSNYNNCHCQGTSYTLRIKLSCAACGNDDARTSVITVLKQRLRSVSVFGLTKRLCRQNMGAAGKYLLRRTSQALPTLRTRCVVIARYSNYYTIVTVTRQKLDWKISTGMGQKTTQILTKAAQ